MRTAGDRCRDAGMKDEEEGRGADVATKFASRTPGTVCALIRRRPARSLKLTLTQIRS